MNCIICGEELVDGRCPKSHNLKLMCLNCCSVTVDENGEYRCVNEEVLDIARKKMLAALPDGYEVGTIEVKPMLLKNPCKKCRSHLLDKNRVIRHILNDVNLGIEDYIEE